MLKLFVVDDEPIIRNGIRSIIEWDKYGYEICGEADDGPSAVKAIIKLKPDLVLLDLHLPGFLGLEVIKRVKAKIARAAPRFLILSGYAEFEYAKEAINLDVNGYIEKPIEEKILIERITSIAGEIENEKTEEHLLIQFMAIMDGVYKEKTHGLLKFNENNICIALVSTENSEPVGENIQIKKIKEYFQENICYIFPYKKYAAVLFENSPQFAIVKQLEKLSDYLGKTGCRPSITLSFCTGEKNCEPGTKLQKACREAEQLQNKTFFFKEIKILTSGDMGSTGGNSDWEINNETAKLCNYIQVVDNERIRIFFRELKIKLYNSGKNPREISLECIAMMIEVRNCILGKISNSKEIMGTGMEILDTIIKQKYLEDIMHTMEEACLHISNSLPLLSADSGLQRVISYVNNNFNDDLKLETLGQLFNYNHAYLGKRFKEFTGKNFHTYLDLLRIKAAKELLLTTKKKVYEISTMIGYANTDYFYEKFKKYTGESPLDFRKKNIRLSD